MHQEKEDAASIVKEGVEKAAKDLTHRLEKYGFRRTKRLLWVRLDSNSADFVHLHREGSSYGRPDNYSVSFRATCGNRKFCDPFESLALNGPGSDSSEARKHRYHLRFNAKSGSTYERCIDDLEKFVLEIGEPWFRSLRKTKVSIFSFLRKAQAPIECPAEMVMASRKLLGVKDKKRE